MEKYFRYVGSSRSFLFFGEVGFILVLVRFRITGFFWR